MAAVSDTSPLVLLAKAGQLQFLRQVYSDIVIPPAVQAEIVYRGAGQEDVAAIDAADWIAVHPLGDQGAIPRGTARPVTRGRVIEIVCRHIDSAGSTRNDWHN